MSRYDDPRWYDEEQDNHPPVPRPVTPENNHYNSYPTYTISEDDPRPLQNGAQRSPAPPTKRRFPFPAQILLVGALLVITFFGGWFSRQLAGDSFNASDPSKSYSQLFDQAWSLIDKNFVDRNAVNYKNMSYAAIQAMVDSLKDTGHTRFLTPQEVQDENKQLSGSFTGIGIYVGQDANTKQIIILGTVPGSPAEKAGIRRNDVILQVNGVSTSGKDLDTVTKMLQGDVNTKVTLTLHRPKTGQTLTITVTRENFTVQSAVLHYIAEDHIAQITLSEFDQGVTDQLKAAMTKAKQEGATKIILDLRGNRGGYLSEAINTASQFIKSGNVVLVRDSSGQTTPMHVNGSPMDTTSPLVVLVDQDTASAAEIVSGALKDNKRATIIGVKTFGTGTVLQQFPLADGSALLIGIQEWLTPNGQFIRNQGIMPNVKVPLDANGTVLSASDANDEAMTTQQVLDSGDNQLVAAIKYLQTH